MLDGSTRWAAIIAARGSAKTWTIALWCVIRIFSKKKRQITIVPGGKSEQGGQIFQYIEDLITINPKLKKKIKYWSGGRIQLKNGNKITINTPTRNGVQSSRGDIVVDEAHLFPAILGPKMEPIASKKGNRIILIGIPEQPSWFKDKWDRIAKAHRDDSVDWREAVKYGVVDEDAVLDYKAGNTEEDFLVQYCNQWVLKSSFVFNLLPWPDYKKWNHLGTTCGIDFNPAEGHAWTVVEFDTDDNWRITKSGITKKGNTGNILEELANTLMRLKSEGVTRFIAEGNALNDGYLGHLRTLVEFEIERDEWNENGKSASVQKGIILTQRGRFFDDVGLPWSKVALDDRGRMIKKIHECDAALHAISSPWGYEHALSKYYDVDVIGA